MLRALLARLGLTRDGAQLELGLLSSDDREVARPAVGEERGRLPARRAPTVAPVPPRVERPQASHRPDPSTPPDDFVRRLRALGLARSADVRLTNNRSTLVSFRSSTLRVHAGFLDAPDDVLRALVVFVSGRGAARTAARRVIVGYPMPRPGHPRPPRPTQTHPDDQPMAVRLQREHARLNVQHFGSVLSGIPVQVSRRMSSRLGHYSPARSHGGKAEIVISRRHVRRHGWPEAVDTLLHEMVHQWQEETGVPIDHGSSFRHKARDVGVTPRARRLVG